MLINISTNTLLEFNVVLVLFAFVMVTTRILVEGVHLLAKSGVFNYVISVNCPLYLTVFILLPTAGIIDFT